MGHAERASGLHEQAETKLDAAEYALHRLMDELSAVMTTPVSLVGWERSASQAPTARNIGLALAA